MDISTALNTHPVRQSTILWQLQRETQTAGCVVITSIQKIAQLAGVSVATVPRVPNHSDTVKAKNRERVLQAIKENNYQPNLLARQLRTARSSMILVMTSNIANPFCTEVAKGIEEETEKNGYHILLCNSGSDTARPKSALKLLSRKIVDGIITTDAFSKLPELTTLIGDAPWVQYAEYADKGTVSCVGINDVDAAQSVISHLVDKGYRRTVLINHDLSYKYARLRERGYKATLHTLSFEYQAVEYASELSSSAGIVAMKTLLAAEVKPGAVFAVSDMLATGTMHAIFDAGLQIPQDIAVVGFDGTELAEMVPPQLSTIEQPSRDISRKAVGLLLNKIENPDVQTERVMMDWRYISRVST